MSKSVYARLLLPWEALFLAFDASVSSGVIGICHNFEFKKLNEWQQRVCASVHLRLAPIFGSLFAGFLSNMFGRKKYIANCFFTWYPRFSQVLGGDYSMLLLPGIYRRHCVLHPLVCCADYIAEISPAKNTQV